MITPFHRAAALFTLIFLGVTPVNSFGAAWEKTTRLWKDGVVSFQFDSSVNEEAQKVIQEVMDEYAVHTPIRFKEKKKTLFGGGSYVKFKVLARTEGIQAHFAGTSVIGSDGGAQELILAPDSATDVYTISHELGHVLGLEHEHQRPDRDTVIQIETDNVKPEARKYFEIQPQIEGLTSFDPASVMNYAYTNNGFAVDGSKPIITVRGQPNSSYYVYKPTPRDYLGVWKLYSTPEKYEAAKADFRSRGYLVE
ncbi:MAG: M12 family metallopeptidase [Bacteriovoracia bacterium]